jgi:hypothetical protein
MSLTVDARAHALLRRDLDPDEGLPWAAKPQAWAYILPPRMAINVGLLWAAFDSFYLAGAFGQGQAWGLLQGLAVRFVSLHVVPAILLLGWPLWRWLSWRNTAYAITGRRILARQGLVGTLTVLAFDQVEGVELSVTGQAFGVGTVTLLQAAPAKPLRLEAVNDAFHVSTLARRSGRVAVLEEGKAPA